MYSRNAARNVLVNLFGQIFVLILNFISRKIFLFILDTNYLGISGLFSSVVTMLSLAELGVGTAITFSLYKPLAEKDNELILSLMNLYKKAYRIIGIFVMVAGAVLTPLALYMTEVENEIPHLKWIYLLFVVNASVSYFYSYNRTLMVADQKEYRLAVIDYVSRLALISSQTAVLVVTENYILYLLMQIIMTFVQNYLVYRKVLKSYPFLLSSHVKPLPERVLGEIKKNTLAMMLYKLAVVIVSGTDNLIISKTLGTVWVGLYANYSMIILSVQTICSKVVCSVTASIGNIVAAGDKERSYQVYEIMQYVCFVIYGMCTVILFVLLNPFIELFLGEEYLISNGVIITVLINFYLLGMQGASASLRDAQGIFWQGKLRPLAQGILNLVISLILVFFMKNLTAVFLGTVLSRVMTVTWFDPYAVHKYGFGDLKKIKYFVKKYMRYGGIVMLSSMTAFYLADLCPVPSFMGIIFKGMIAVLTTAGFIFAGTFRMPEFRFLIVKIRQFRRNFNEK